MGALTPADSPVGKRGGVGMSGEGVTLHSLFTNMTGTHIFNWNTHKPNCKTCSCTLLTRARVLSQVLSGGASLGVLHVLRHFCIHTPAVCESTKKAFHFNFLSFPAEISRCKTPDAGFSDRKKGSTYAPNPRGHAPAHKQASQTTWAAANPTCPTPCPRSTTCTCTTRP